ncbi:MAG: ABC transporter ATP-binding protein [Spirochaetales bacterium]|nr:ABC transporter ATP-binding protein [Spirochaetales bacterium]
MEEKKQTREPRMGMRRPGHHGRHIESPAHFGKALRRLVTYLGSQVVILSLAALFTLASVFFMVITPVIIGNAITEYLEKTQNLTAFLQQIILIFLIYVCSWITNAISGILMTRMGNKVIFRLRNELFSHIQTLSMSYFDSQGIGDLISRVTNDIQMIYDALVNAYYSLISSIFTIIGVVIGMFILNIPLALAVLCVVPFMFLVTGIIGKKVRNAFRENQTCIGQISAMIQESFSGIRVIKSFFREQAEYEKFEKMNARTRAAGEKAYFISFLFMPVMLFFTGVILAVITGLGGTLIITVGGTFTIGLLTSFILYSRRFFESLRQITNVYNVVQSALAGAERVFQVMDARQSIEIQENPLVVDTAQGDVVFTDVFFGYKKGEYVLKDINFQVKKGEIIAIVGPTGAGKTTLVNLMSRFYDVDEGGILLDNINIKDIDIHFLRRKMGVVLQEPFFFSTSIRENLKYGKPDATDEEMINAAVIANADPFIRKLPQGYDTVLTERGMNLSQGERQLMAIARAILVDPKILILDEATSNIDSLTESHIQKGLLQLMQGRTSFIIAHRLSTVKNADKVLVIHDHRIIEQGTHDELMKNKGFYFRLYNLQLKKPEITEDMAI